MKTKRVVSCWLLVSLCIAGVSPALGQSLVFPGQTIEVPPQYLAVESVVFQPLEVVTNTVLSWEDGIEITTNGLFGSPPNAVITNAVQFQTSETVVSTNAAVWLCNVDLVLPRGYRWPLNNHGGQLLEFRYRLDPIPVSPATVTATLGEAAAGLEFAASNGAFKPTGQIRDAFLSFVAAVLEGE